MTDRGSPSDSGSTPAITELDLTNEEAPPNGPALDQPMQVEVDIDVVREGWRGRIAAGLLAVMAAFGVGAFASIAFDWATASELKDLLTAVYNPMVGLFGAVIGFYFGTTRDGEAKVSSRQKESRR